MGEKLETARRHDAWRWLCNAPLLCYSDAMKALVRYFGTVEAIPDAPEKEFAVWKELRLPWVNDFLAYRQRETPESVRELARRMDIRFVQKEEAAFPEKLRTIPDCPMGLFYRGKLPENGKPAVAIVGARKCSNYGTQMAAVISEALTLAGFQIVSGMAMGIDGISQRACLSRGGYSCAVLGSGVDVCYPPMNRDLYDQLLTGGGIVSEYPVGTAPLGTNFPRRNRIISGLADALVVVEARKKSGTLITADQALEQGRDVFAVPGRFSDELSYGCNHLIAQGAGIIVSPDELVSDLCVLLDMKKPSRKRSPRLPKDLTPAEQTVYSALTFDPQSVDALLPATSLSLGELLSALMSLEMRGLAREPGKNLYTLRLAGS